jgi:hypothetical protein
MRYLSLFMVAVIFSLPLSAELSIEDIQKMVRDIRAKRTSKMEHNTTVASPFAVMRQSNGNVVMASAQDGEASFSLGAIVNTSAFIDGDWYKAGEMVGIFRVSSIATDHVVLESENRKITLFFKPSKRILKTSKE